MSKTRSVGSPPGKDGDDIADLMSQFVDLCPSPFDVEREAADFELLDDDADGPPDDIALSLPSTSASVSASTYTPPPIVRMLVPPDDFFVEEDYQPAKHHSAATAAAPALSCPRILRLIWDADGCAYNDEYRRSLFFFIHENCNEIDALEKIKDTDGGKRRINVLKEKLHDKISSGAYKSRSNFDLRAQVMQEDAFQQARNNLCQLGKERLIEKLKALGLNDWCAKVIREKDSNSLEWVAVERKVAALNNADANLYFNWLTNNHSLNWIMQEYIGKLQHINEDFHPFIFAGTNMALTQHLFEDKDCYDELKLMVGSNRQSYEDDQYCKWLNSTGSIFKDLNGYLRVLKEIFAGKPVAIDPTTMTDIQNRLIPGETFRRILENAKEHATYHWDERKGTMIYSFCHRAVVEHPLVDRVENPGQYVTVKFADDREDIIRGLYGLFDNNRDLLPKGLTLKLIRYTGQIHMELTVVGTGLLDRDYMASSTIMTRLSDTTSPDGSRLIFDSVTSLSNPDVMRRFLDAREAEKQRCASMCLAVTGGSSLFAPKAANTACQSHSMTELSNTITQQFK